MSAATRAARDALVLDEYEMRFLRKCVRFELGLRKTRPQPGWYVDDAAKVARIRAFAKTFVEQDY